MRAFIVSIVLAVAVVVCVAFVALFAGPNVSSAMLASLGLAISMVAALFAAIAALGPKFRPTPVLTPAIAGTAAAALTTVAIVAGSAHFGQAHRAAMHAGEPARVTTPPAEVQSKASGPAPIPFPRLTDDPALPTPLYARPGPRSSTQASHGASNPAGSTAASRCTGTR